MNILCCDFYSTDEYEYFDGEGRKSHTEVRSGIVLGVPLACVNLAFLNCQLEYDDNTIKKNRVINLLTIMNTGQPFH